MTGNRGMWLHAVTRGFDPARLAGVTGVGGAPVRAVGAAGLVALVAPVDLAEYGEEALRRNLEDLAWLESVAREHHGVADAVSRLGPAVPARLATVYRDEDRVRTMLAQRRDAFAAVLDRVAGRIEWGVKAYAATGAPTEGSDQGSTGPSPARTGGAGTSYLRRRRAQLLASEVAQQAAADGAEGVHRALVPHAEAARRHPPQDRRLSGVADWMVLNGAYLVAAKRAGEFADRVNALAERYRAVRLELTGPWPPYSFAVLAGEEPAR
jgi:hypothetical protein